MRLDCGQCVLRPWAAGDEPSLVRHANNYTIWRNLRDSFPHPYTLADAEQWISFTQQQSPQTFFADYERLPGTSEAFVYVGMTRLMVRRLARA